MKLRVAKMTKDASLSDMMAIGTRVLHSERGCGKVIAVDADDPRHKPYIIEFDNGQVERLPPGPCRSSISNNHLCASEPVGALAAAGQVHHYSSKSMKKLTLFMVPYDDQLVINDTRVTLTPEIANRKTIYERTC